MAHGPSAFFWRVMAVALPALAVSGCGFFDRAERPAWRNAAERACIANQGVRVTRHVTPRSSIDGPGICGVNNPYYVTAFAGGTVRLKSRATLGCPMIATVERWLKDVVQPAALARFGQPVTEISTMGSYACRRRNHRPGAKLSEHAFGNALDIGSFTTADGRKLKVAKHWRRGDTQERAFLRETHAGACRYFRTVLGPGADRFHENHFHLDLAMHGRTSRGLRHYCRPVIKDIAPPPRRDDLPDPPLLKPDPEIAQRMNSRRRIAARHPAPGLPIGRIPRSRLHPMPGLRSFPRGSAEVLRPPNTIYDQRTYGRLRRLEPGAPLLLAPPASIGNARGGARNTGARPGGKGYIRADGVYVAPGH